MTNEIRQAISDFRQAEQNFYLADIRFIDVAIYQFNAAKAKLDALLNERRDIDVKKITRTKNRQS